MKSWYVVKEGGLGSHRRVVVLEVTGVPKRISFRDPVVKRIVRQWENIRAGNTERLETARREAQELAVALNEGKYIERFLEP